MERIKYNNNNNTNNNNKKETGVQLDKNTGMNMCQNQ